MAGTGKRPLAGIFIEVVAHDVGSCRRHLRRIGQHLRHGRRQVQSLREVMLRIVECGFVLITESQIQCDPGVYLPIVLDVHAIEPYVRIRDGAADHLRGTVECAQQEGGIRAAIVQGVGIVEGVGRQRRIEVEIRRARYVAETIAFAFFKAGFEERESYGLSYVSSTSNFYFNSALTANTFNNPDTLHYGSPYATFLLGALDGSSQMIGGPVPDPHVRFYGMYIQDDWKVNSRVTLNLGLRDEYETALYDPEHNFSQGLDLSAPVPEMLANPPQMPAAATNIVGNNFYKYTGQWSFTSSSHPGSFNPQKLALQPRAGLAYRIDDKTALRFGYARYLVPCEMNIALAPVSGYETVGFLEPPFLGMTGYQNTLGTAQGVPQETISNPYPTSSNPLLPILGKGYGGNLGRGGQPLLWYNPNQQKARNDRLNVNFQRQVRGEVVVSATYFLNIGNQQYTKA